MKKISALILTFVMLLSCAACGESKDPAETPAPSAAPSEAPAPTGEPASGSDITHTPAPGEKPEDVASVFGIMRNNVDQIMARTREKLKKLALQYADICNG